MTNPQKRKETSFETNQIRSVLFVGDPNEEKRKLLEGIQTAYTVGVNRFIALLEATPSLLLPVIKNDKHDGGLRKLEKDNRIESLGCAMSQAVFDDAVTMLSNRYENILMKMRSDRYDIFTSSKVLFCMSIQGKSKEEMASAMSDIARAVKRSPDFYLDAVKQLNKMTQGDFDLRMTEFALSYSDASSSFRVPNPRKMWVSLSSKTHDLEEAEHIKTTHVIQIANPGARCKRISVPITASKNSVRRMRQYGCAKSCRYTIDESGRLRVSVAFKKHTDRPETVRIVGVDTGILDCLYTSDGKHYGSFKEVLDYYEKVVEPSFGALSSLRNKKKILHFIHTHKNLPYEVRRSLLKKVSYLEGMIQAAQEPYHKLRSYHHQVEAEIPKAIEAYISSIDKSTLTVLELLDIREFNKGRKTNGKMSRFARGELQRKLMEALNWHGFDFMEVDPAYTSQACPVCSCVDKKNRNAKQFRCTCCGYEQDADYNAAGNIRARAEDEEIRKVCKDNQFNTDKRHAALKELYASRHEKWLKANQTAGVQAAAHTP